MHKWLGGPLGTGCLYVRRDRIPGLRPLFGDTHHSPTDIRKLERFGNRPDSAVAGLKEAIRWHEALGAAAKYARLSYLHRSWAGPLRLDRRFRVLTPQGAGRSGAIGLFTLEGVPPEKLFDHLMERYGILTALHTVNSTRGLRVTPGLPTPRSHLLRLVEALTETADRWI